MVELAAVNRSVVGSSPTSGAIFFFQVRYWTYILQNPNGLFYIGHAQSLNERTLSHNDTNACNSDLLDIG